MYSCTPYTENVLYRIRSVRSTASSVLGVVPFSLVDFLWREGTRRLSLVVLNLILVPLQSTAYRKTFSNKGMHAPSNNTCNPS